MHPPPPPQSAPSTAVSGFLANAALAWRATTRSPAYRVIAALVLVSAALAPLAASRMFMFAESHTRAEMLVSNVFLWAFVFSFFVLPPIADRLRGCGPVAWRAVENVEWLQQVAAIGTIDRADPAVARQVRQH